MQPNYQFYPTLLDAFQRYLDGRSGYGTMDEGFQEMIDKINRVPFSSEAADRGTAFNKLIDLLIMEGRQTDPMAGGDLLNTLNHLVGTEGATMLIDGFDFPVGIIYRFYNNLRWSVPQVRCEGAIQTSHGLVRLYGYIDNLSFGSAKDIKTCKDYILPKYLYNWQHVVYPYCLIQMGVQGDAARYFQYLVTDFKEYWEEDYYYNEVRDEARLRGICERFIDFIEMNRHLITDKKLFGGVNEPHVLLASHTNGVTIIEAAN